MLYITVFITFLDSTEIQGIKLQRKVEPKEVKNDTKILFWSLNEPNTRIWSSEGRAGFNSFRKRD